MPPTNPHTRSALDKLVALLTLERIDDNLFRGAKSTEGWQRVYGGQVLGQALAAAAATVPQDRMIHSLHGYFILAGDPEHEIVYDVERIRDGGSFTTRRVKAIQHGRAIFTMNASFHKAEEGLEHQSAMPDVPSPDTLPSAKDLMLRNLTSLPPNMRAYWQREHPLEVRLVSSIRAAIRAGISASRSKRSGSSRMGHYPTICGSIRRFWPTLRISPFWTPRWSLTAS